jgi:hypothetical protein
MASENFKRVMAGLEDLLAHTRGEPGKAFTLDEALPYHSSQQEEGAGDTLDAPLPPKTPGGSQ